MDHQQQTEMDSSQLTSRLKKHDAIQLFLDLNFYFSIIETAAF